jgi:hypothetical protein
MDALGATGPAGVLAWGGAGWVCGFYCPELPRAGVP